MQPPKRQIIKTRSQHPYVVARFIIALVILAAIVIGLVMFLRPHRGHALAPRPAHLALQEAHTAGRRAQSHICTGLVRS